MILCTATAIVSHDIAIIFLSKEIMNGKITNLDLFGLNVENVIRI